MTTTNFRAQWSTGLIIAIALSASVISAAAAKENLLKNPDFEAGTDAAGWTTVGDSAGKATVTDREAHSGRNAIAIPGNTAVEQKVGSLPAGAYLASCWVKSEADQSVTFVLSDPDRPWASYTCAETKVPHGQWVRIEAFCTLDRPGSLTLSVGGMSQDFRNYHGTAGEMKSPIVADDFELIRSTPSSKPLKAWDAKSSFSISGGEPVFQFGNLVAAVRKADGGLIIYALANGAGKQRCIITPSIALTSAKYASVNENNRTGIRITSDSGDKSYVAWFSDKGLVSIESTQVPQFIVQNCHLRHGLLPSFAGADICYSAAKMPAAKEFRIPSTQWFVGLVDGHDSMLVAAWDSDTQAVSLGLAGEGQNRMIDSVSIATGKGFSLSFVEHAGIWHQEALKEEWLGEYTAIGWERPFPARWTAHFFVSPGGKPSFRNPYMDYSFPIAYTKTRMWGVWFEDWNHYPFFFDGQRTMAHFEKSFIPNGDALIYFLEPAVADLYSPCEIVEQALGSAKAAAMFDFDANRLRRLKYSTPNQFMFDRPVCATTTRLSKIKQEDKPTVGIDLATHLYEFIREIRGRVEQYDAYFTSMKDYLATQKKSHPELSDYISELEPMVVDAQSKSAEIYSTPLPDVQKKIDAMKQLLKEGKGDGFNCGDLDVRGTAGSQDDLCRRFNRVALRLEQTAAMKCGDSPEKAKIAKYIWDQSRAVLREPTRWEARRTLFFSEP